MPEYVVDGTIDSRMFRASIEAPNPSYFTSLLCQHFGKQHNLDIKPSYKVIDDRTLYEVSIKHKRHKVEIRAANEQAAREAIIKQNKLTDSNDILSVNPVKRVGRVVTGALAWKTEF